MSLRIASVACSAAVLALTLGSVLGTHTSLASVARPDRLAHLQASNAERADVFGGALGLSADGTLLVVGADLEASASIAAPQDNSLPGAGAAYVFERKVSGWSQRQMLKAAQPAAGAGFGFQVGASRDGALMVVSAPFESVAPDTEGRLHLFVREGLGGWRAAGAVDAPAGLTRFGIELALARDGRTLVATAVDGSGRARVLTHAWVNGAWQLLGAGVSAGSGGHRLAISDDGQRLVVADAVAGTVRVLERAGRGWKPQATLRSPSGAVNGYGQAVALSADGRTLAIGNDRGEIELLQRQQGGWVSRQRVSVAVATNTTRPAQRLVLSADGGRLAVGLAGGVVQWFERRGGAWLAQGALHQASPGDDQFGGALALSADGELLAVGARLEALHATPPRWTGEGAGAVHMFALGL